LSEARNRAHTHDFALERNLNRLFGHPVFREWWLITIGLLIFAAVAIRGDWLGRLDASLYDQAMRVWQRPASTDVIIIGIDEASLNQIGRWPWSRAVHATLLDKVASQKPKVIALDLILVEADRRDAAADQTLADAIKRAGNVIVPVVAQISDGLPQGEAKPIPAIAEAARGLAHIGAMADPDGVMRRVELVSHFGRNAYPSLGAKVYSIWRGVPTPGERSLYVPYLGTSGTVKTVPYIDVLRGDVNLDLFRDKVVFIGTTAGGSGDEYPTPVTGATRSMPGVEIHANVLQALDEGIVLKRATPLQSMLLSSVVVVALMMAFLWLSPRRALLTSIGGILLLGVGAILLFRFGQLWISPTVAIIAVLLAYPLWSWRKLEATQRFFDAELKRLTDEPLIVPDTAARMIAPSSVLQRLVPDVIEQRIENVTAASQRLRSLKRFVEASIESLPTAAIVTDLHGRIMLSNSAADRLLSAQAGTALEDQQILEALPSLTPSYIGGWPAVWKQIASDASVLTVEAQRARGESEENFVLQFAPLTSQPSALNSAPAAMIAGVIVSIADITPLRESERRRDEALRFLSHDMRSPQAAILTLLDMVRDDPESITQENLLTRVGKYAKRTLTLADDFLRLAKAERARPADFREVELGEIIADVADEADALASAKLMRIEIDNHLDEAWVMADRDLLTRAIINILSNAIKYSPDKSMVVIGLDALEGPDGALFRIRVVDNGFGMSPENLAKLFTRFQRFTTEGQPQADGIGLGLVFVKTVIERMGGEVGVSSRLEDGDDGPRGTTFTVTLPRAEA
jgi:CHASE2 domain-containing sensor protein/signal transduction histidine kinase